MALTYGFLKGSVQSTPKLQSSRHKNETQYHIHTGINAGGGNGSEIWDTAVNVGTNDSDDLLNYKLIFDFSHPITAKLSQASEGFNELTGGADLPSMDFLRSNVLQNTGPWRVSDVMDGSDQSQPAAALIRLLERAKSSQLPVYIFGRKYIDGNGVHDVHMNQGSTGSFLNHGNDGNDHNDVWQDGAVIVDLGDGQWAGYFTTFTQQMVPTDRLGNPLASAHSMSNADDGSLEA